VLATAKNHKGADAYREVAAGMIAATGKPRRTTR